MEWREEIDSLKTGIAGVPAAPSGMAMLGAPMELVAYTDAGTQRQAVLAQDKAQESFSLKPAPGAAPGVITVQYSDADVQGAEEDLRFYTWTGSEWAEPSCAGHTLQHMVEDNMFLVPICETGIFALFGDSYSIYLPLIIR